MKLRLFALRDTRTNAVVPNLNFPSKPEARAERDARNGGAEAPKSFVITYGPDHHRFNRG